MPYNTDQYTHISGRDVAPILQASISVWTMTLAAVVQIQQNLPVHQHLRVPLLQHDDQRQPESNTEVELEETRFLLLSFRALVQLIYEQSHIPVQALLQNISVQ